MTSLGATLVGTCCGVGLVGVSAFLGVVLVFLFAAVVGTVADFVEWLVQPATSAPPRPAQGSSVLCFSSPGASVRIVC